MTIYPPSVSAALHYQENHATGDLLCSSYRTGLRHALLIYPFFGWRSQTKTIIYILGARAGISAHPRTGTRSEVIEKLTRELK